MSDIESTDWSEIAANNIQPAPGGWPPNSSPNIVYSNGREDMGAIKRAWNRLGPTVTSTGSANAQVLSYTSNPTALVRGQGYCFIAGFTNTGPMTLTVGALAAVNVFQDGVALGGGEVRAGLIIEVFYDGTNYQITSGRALASLASSFGFIRNFLINPLFNVQQRGAQGAFSMAVAANTAPYTFDRWYLAVGANQASTVVANGPLFGGASGPYGAIITRTTGQTGVGSIQFAQTLDTDVIQLLAGQQVTIGAQVTAQSGFTGAGVSLQLIAGTGSPTRTTAGFTGAVACCNSGVVAIPSTPTATGVVPANTRQLEYRLTWTPVGTAPANDGFNMYAPRLNLGPVDLGPDLTRILTTELPICQRFYDKTFNSNVAPAQNAGANIGELRANTIVAGVASTIIMWYPPVTMRATPTLLAYNPVAANAFARNITTSTDATATAINVGGNNAFQIAVTAPAGWGVNNIITVHATADAEIL